MTLSRGGREFLLTVFVVALLFLLLMNLSLPANAAAALGVVVVCTVLVRRSSRVRALTSAVCPLDGAALRMDAKRWGPHGNPLLTCLVDQHSFTVTRWVPLEFCDVTRP